MSDLAEEKGFEVGKLIQRKADKAVAKIDSYQNDMVIVVVQDGPISGKAQFPIENLLAGKWKVIDKKPDPEFLTDLESVRPSTSTDMQVQVLKAQIIAELWKLEQQHEAVHKNLMIQLKPFKAVFVTVKVAKGKLVLVPTSSNIKLVKPSQDMKVSKALCGGSVCLSGCSQDYVLFIQPQYQPVDKPSPFVNAAFFLRSSTDMDECNMEIHPKFAPTDLNRGTPCKIPCLRNFKPIEKDEELVVYVEETEDTPEDDLKPLIEPSAPSLDPKAKPASGGKRRRVKSAA